mmetsp:Transcript_8509/g.24408  ORF Transcript_8509/g.24408 Transcript_8509/m.24408 type:complete len:188 (+) Transcript_8509:228-791(+)|eukprot:CAMPEP_0117673614 /NCGR_PEP_ID=MMETSP0804-20121206/14568_1 /TAXON_ID=1074897 /ORGANISM="Tetraselmis astigmatica, Strain CCMP880" /LENGTH=187 /DNA_ID=CAMNT_0005482367 /DNA_START=151 /DNA_END=714 /DNA_ORIENTATION=+
MVKSKKQGRAGKKAAFEKQGVTPGSDAVPAGRQPSKRLKSKVDRKMNFIARVATSAISVSGGVNKKKTTAKRKVSKALADMSSLDEVLKGISSSGASAKRPGKRAGTGLTGAGQSRARMTITKKENSRLQTVINHPHYKAQPLSAIMSHLQATLPPPELPQKNKDARSKDMKSKKISKSHGASDMET